ncbi:MAG: Ig-like domain repeat protein, partial [Methanosphaera sp.]|nr:Ig-like domain repeat protein [Methanosphaera sp.]
TLLAEKMETKLLVNDVSTEVGKEFNITGTLLDINDKPVMDALVNITVNGTKTNATTNENGQFNTTMTLQMMGNHQITAIFYGNEVYNQSTNNTALVTASKTDTHIILKVSNNTPVNDTVITITVNLTDNTGEPLDNQEVNITIGTERFTMTTTNGIASKQYRVNKLGTQTITASYDGNNMYNANSTTTQINVIKLDTKLTLNVSDNTPVNNTPITITATLTDTRDNKLEGKNITLNINGKNQTITTNNNGTATQTYTPTNTGKQTITAAYNGDSQYNNSTKQSTQINVIKLDTKLTLKVSNNTPINSTTINITATLTDTKGNKLANQNITIKVSDKTYTVKTNKDGIAIQNYTPTKVEKQTITATYKGDSKYTGSTATTNITVKKINTKITLTVSNNTPVNNTPITITATLTDTSNNKLANQNITLNINGKTVTTKTNANGTVTRTYTPTTLGSQNITAAYNGDSKYTNSTKTTKITVRNKYNTKTVTTAVTGVIGEKLTLTATVTDTNNNKINEGNLIFKINGVTIKDNGKLTGSSNPLKVKVTNGIATATLTPDLNIVNSDKITASYIGTTIYNASTSTPASIKISKRNATIEITTNKKIVKQGQVLTITAKIYDTTGGKKSTNLAAYSDEFVYFKINGVTVKDEKGEMLKVKVVNGVATLNYTVPLGISCVLDTQSMTPKNHTIQVGFYNKNYQDIISNNPHFQVERSNITINLANATINNKTHKLSMKITIKDYLGNVVVGPNKLVIKVNGVTLKNGTQVMYYYTTDGVLDLKNTPVPQAKNYTSVEVITQDRLAYKSQRNTTTVIKMTN